MRTAIAVAALLSIAACRTPPPAAAPATAESLGSLEQRRLQSLMHKLAGNVHDVHDVLRDEGALTGDQGREVVRLLTEIDDLAVAIADEPEAKKHRNFTAFFPAFAISARKARYDAAAEPPNYVSVREMMQVCVACHTATR